MNKLYIKDDAVRVVGVPPESVSVEHVEVFVEKKSTVEMKTVLEADVFCAKCGLGLCAICHSAVSPANQFQIFVPPCPRCAGALA